MPRRVLKVVKERKLAQFIAPPAGSAVLEASGVVAKGNCYYVIFDNVRQIARVDRRLVPGSKNHGWFGRAREGDGYEDIAYSSHRRRFYLLIEAEKHPDGTYKAMIDECDESGRFERRRWVEFGFEKRNTGFEGLAAVRRQGEDYLLALCEGNRCRPGRRGRKPGGGRIHVLRKNGPIWEPIERIKLPRSLDFEDYAAVALRGERIAVVSQQSSRLWIGRLRLDDWTIVGRGRTFDFPRTDKGKRLYCTVEGLCWLTADTFVAVSDLSKRGYPGRCRGKDESIHIFRVP
jgi:hypothetical protein